MVFPSRVVVLLFIRGRIPDIGQKFDPHDRIGPAGFQAVGDEYDVQAQI